MAVITISFICADIIVCVSGGGGGGGGGGGRQLILLTEAVYWYLHYIYDLVLMLYIMYYTVCYLTGIFYAVVRQISMLFRDNKISVFCIIDASTVYVRASCTSTMVYMQYA